jgi:hypothetical protein
LDGFWAAATAALVKSAATLMLGICSVSQIVKSAYAYAWYVVGIRTVVVVDEVEVVGRKTLKVNKVRVAAYGQHKLS